MTDIPCEQDPRLRAEIERFAEVLKTQAHKLGDHGLDESAFYASPIFRGAIEKVRGEFSATMGGKREFVQHVLNHMEDGGFIAGWDRTRLKARNDYYVQLKSGRLAVVDLKGCLDGENTNKFERPADAKEFITWSLCTNLLIPEEAAPQFLDDAAPRNGMMPPPDSEMIAPPITE